MEKFAKYWRETLCAVLFLATEQFYRNPLYSYSLDLITSWQQSAPVPITENFMKFVSIFGEKTVLTLLMLGIFSFSPRRFFLRMLLIYAVSQCMYSLMKEIYHNPRLYFSSDSVAAISCGKGYGNPSGHAVTTVAVYGSLWVMVYEGDWKDFFPQKWIRLFVKWTTLALALVIMVLTFFARVYLGVHSVNHVLFGALLGAWVVFCFGVALRPRVETYIDFVTREKQQFGLTRCGISILLLAFAVQALNLVMYLKFRHDSEFAQSDWLRRINQKYHGLLDKHDMISDSFTSVLHTVEYPLLYLSQLFSSRVFPSVFGDWYSHIGGPHRGHRRIAFALLHPVQFCDLRSVCVHRCCATWCADNLGGTSAGRPGLA